MADTQNKNQSTIILLLVVIVFLLVYRSCESGSSGNGGGTGGNPPYTPPPYKTPEPPEPPKNQDKDLDDALQNLSCEINSLEDLNLLYQKVQQTYSRFSNISEDAKTNYNGLIRLIHKRSEGVSYDLYQQEQQCKEDLNLAESVCIQTSILSRLSDAPHDSEDCKREAKEKYERCLKRVRYRGYYKISLYRSELNKISD